MRRIHRGKSIARPDNDQAAKPGVVTSSPSQEAGILALAIAYMTGKWYGCEQMEKLNI